MFPGVDGFHWTFGHVLFLSLFFGVVVAIVTTVVIALRRTASDVKSGRAAQICWNADFSELPSSERRCRHELTGRATHRTCERAFDCGRCPDHGPLLLKPTSAAPLIGGLSYPADRLYDRGHTWVRREDDQTFTVGLDDFAEHLFGRPDSVKLPPVGSHIARSSLAWRIRKNGHDVLVRSPIAGIVIETGDPERGWYLRLRASSADLTHLLSETEVPGWLGREVERLQRHISPAAPSMADGGTLVKGLMDSVPKANWDPALASAFLAP